MFRDSWLVWALMSAVFAAVVSILAKLGLQRTNSDVAQFVRTAIVLLAIGMLVIPSGRLAELAHWETATWIFMVLCGLATAASWLCYFRALEIGQASKVSAVDKLSVIIVALLAVIFLKEPINALSWFGIALVTCGALILSVSR